MSSELLVKTAQDKYVGFVYLCFCLCLRLCFSCFHLCLCLCLFLCLCSSENLPSFLIKCNWSTMVIQIISQTPARFQFRFCAQSTDAACLLFCDLQEKIKETKRNNYNLTGYDGMKQF